MKKVTLILKTKNSELNIQIGTVIDRLEKAAIEMANTIGTELYTDTTQITDYVINVVEVD